MLPFLKKPTDKAGPLLAPAWHPNFRDEARLPDTKVVRTSFFVNGVAIFITVVIAIYTAYQEYSLYDARMQTERQQAQIDADKPASDRAVAMFKKFQDEEKKTKELQEFLDGRVIASDFLLRLGETLPKKIAITYVNYRSGGVTLRGLVRGTPDQASGEASTYVDLLRKDAKFMAAFENVTLTNISRSPESGWLVLELFLKTKPPATKGSKP